MVPTNDTQITEIFEIDRNFYLKIFITLKGFQLTFEGFIFHKNWSQLKLPIRYWKTLS